jgi:hypothetical protein
MLEGVDEDDSHGKAEEEGKVDDSPDQDVVCCRGLVTQQDHVMYTGGGPIPHFTRLI